MLYFQEKFVYIYICFAIGSDLEKFLICSYFHHYHINIFAPS